MRSEMNSCFNFSLILVHPDQFGPFFHSPPYIDNYPLEIPMKMLKDKIWRDKEKV